MLNYGLMNLISELENEFISLGEALTPNLVRVATKDREYELRLPQLGLDFVAGLHQGVVLVLPVQTISQVMGSYLPIRTELTLQDFLARQRTPIRLRLTTSEQQSSCWLLNLENGWLRVAIAKDVSWVPISAIRSMEIVAVDNSNH